MVISELQKILRAMKKAHGDLSVRVFDFEWHAFCDIDSEYIKARKDGRSDFLCLTPVDGEK